MSTPTHSIVSKQNDRFAVALMTGANGTEVNTTWGDFATYLGACKSAQGDSQERYGLAAIFGDNIRETQAETEDEYIVTFWDGSRWATVMESKRFWAKRLFTTTAAEQFISEYEDQVHGKMKALYYGARS